MLTVFRDACLQCKLIYHIWKPGHDDNKAFYPGGGKDAQYVGSVGVSINTSLAIFWAMFPFCYSKTLYAYVIAYL